MPSFIGDSNTSSGVITGDDDVVAVVDSMLCISTTAGTKKRIELCCDLGILLRLLNFQTLV